MRHAIIISTLLLLSQFVAAERTVLEVIQLTGRPAEELQPLLAPLLNPEDRIVANGYDLIVRTTPARLVEIKQLISRLDTQPHNLLITVLQGRDISAQELNAGAGITLNIPLDKPSAATSSIKGGLQLRENNTHSDHTQTLRTVEGHTAYIKVGKTYPIQDVRTYHSPYRHNTTTRTTDFYEATTGFAVTPRLSGDQLTIDILPWSEQMRHDRYFETRGAHTTIRTNPGEWVEIGSQEQNEQLDQRGILSKSLQIQKDTLRVLIKIEKID